MESLNAPSVLRLRAGDVRVDDHWFEHRSLIWRTAQQAGHDVGEHAAARTRGGRGTPGEAPTGAAPGKERSDAVRAQGAQRRGEEDTETERSDSHWGA